MSTETTTQPVTYAHGAIADKRYDVTAARLQDRFTGREIKVGDSYYGVRRVERIELYTGFAGCPARYYITVTDTRGKTSMFFHKA